MLYLVLAVFACRSWIIYREFVVIMFLDAELQKYLDRSYWEQRSTEAEKPAEPVALATGSNGL